MRVYCTNCHHTHALLLSSIVPYSRASLIDQCKIVKAYEGHVERVEEAASNDTGDAGSDQTEEAASDKAENASPDEDEKASPDDIGDAGSDQAEEAESDKAENASPHKGERAKNDKIFLSDLNKIMDETPSIDIRLIAWILRKYIRHWRQRLLSLRTRIADLNELSRCCLATYVKQFMQIKCTPNIFFSPPT